MIGWIFVIGVLALVTTIWAYLNRYDVWDSIGSVAAVLWLILLILFGVCIDRAYGASIPPNAAKYLPILIEEADDVWFEMPLPSALAAQVEQETCISLTHSKCWNPHAELKTSREYGFGLGQLTVTSRFNAFEEVREMDRGLKAWKWEDRYDPRMQLRALVIKDRFNWRQFPDAASVEDQLAFALAAYNGGVGGTRADKKLCSATPGCNPREWFDNVALTSLKAKTKVKGYGKSFFEINREYVYNILKIRRQKYVGIMED